MPPPTDPKGQDGAPEYRVYRSRKPWLSRGGRDDRDELAQLRGDPSAKRARPSRQGMSGWRITRWILGAIAVWVLVSSLVFLISAQIQQGQVADAANQRLGGAGYPLWSPNNILVLGSDVRTSSNAEPGAQTSGNGRSDSILLLRVGGGANSRMAIARDTIVEIPGHGRGKINGAFSIGGPALAIETVEAYTGIDINHVVLVSFADFPELIDAMGGITYRGGCVVSRINGGFARGGYTLRLKAGKTHIDGKQALALARTRKNECNKQENDLTRARRQQKVVGAMKRRLLSPFAFVRLPMIAWAAPRSLRSDMSGPTLLGLFAALATSGSPAATVLGTESGQVPDELKERVVRRFLAG